MPRIAFVAKTSTNVGFLYRSGTGERCRIGAGRRFVFIHQVAELFCMKWLRGRHLESVRSNRKSDSINRFILWVKSCQISSRSDSKRRSLRVFFTAGRPNKKNKKNNKVSSGMRSVPDLNACSTVIVQPYWSILQLTSVTDRQTDRQTY